MIGIILAGGRATRLGGGDKGTHEVGGIPILDRVVASLRPQCSGLVINANGAAARFVPLGLPVVADDLADHPGPLAGVLAGLDWVASHAPDTNWALVAPTDTPFLPGDLVARLSATQAATGAAIVCARSGGTTHPVVALWRVALRHDLRTALVGEGLRKVGLFLERHAAAGTDWPIEPHDPFLNVNSAADLRHAGSIAAGFDRRTGGAETLAT